MSSAGSSSGSSSSSNTNSSSSSSSDKKDETKLDLPEATGKCRVPYEGNPTVPVFKTIGNASDPSLPIVGTLSPGAVISVADAGADANGIHWYQVISIETGRTSTDDDDGDDDDEDDTDSDDDEKDDDSSSSDSDKKDDSSSSDDKSSDSDKKSTSSSKKKKEEEDKDLEEEDTTNPAIGGFVPVAIIDKNGHKVVCLQVSTDVEDDKASTQDGKDADKDTDEEGEDEDEDEDDDDEDYEESPFYIDDNFYLSYQAGAQTRAEYRADLEQGFHVCDIRGILGIPHQFLPTTDTRIDSDGVGGLDSLGRLYTSKVISHMPLLFMTAGVPQFMAGFSKEQKNIAILNLFKIDMNAESAFLDYDLDNVLTSRKGRYYSLKFSYTSYFYYVNAMLRSAAVFLDLEDKEVDGKRLGEMDWYYYSTNPGEVMETYSDEGEEPDTEQRDIFGHAGLSRLIGPYTGSVVIYADCGNSTDDSFSNTTTQSQLSSALNSLSDTGRELNFLIGNVGGTLGLTLTKLTGAEDLENNQAKIAEIIDKGLGSGQILSNIINKCQTILAGGRMLFPEIWADSSFARSYSCKMKLISPGGDKFSIFMNILVPLYHMLAFVLPRQSIDQSYFSPFLVRAFCQSMFNVDMGIVTDLSVTKGSEGEWTNDGLPTVAEISFSIKDMYDGMYMSTAQSSLDMNIMNNVAELDYIANSCGINIHDQDISRTITYYKKLNFFGRINDTIELGIVGELQQWANQQVDNMFGWH